jgi:hypothetical protein
MFSSNIIIILFSLILFIFFINIIIVNCDTVKEPWVNYTQLPYGNINSGAGNKGITPLVFYEHPIYRRPYNYPVCQLVDYPVPHCRTNSL